MRGRAIPFAVLALVAAGVAGAIVRAGPPEPATYLVQIDAVVTDDAGKPVTDLTRSDFQVKDDGKTVDLKTFDAVIDSDPGAQPVARSIVLLLDDSGVGAGNTLPIQMIARVFVASMAAADEFSVVRLSSRRDEAFGDRLEALMRISEYRSDALPFFGRETIENALQVMSKVSRALEAIEHRRKALVCIGAPAVCSIPEPFGSSSVIWRSWVDAMGAMARANASVYSLEPSGSLRRLNITGGGIADVTGGDAFPNTSDMTRPIQVVRRDTGNYYLLGYWPVASDRALHSVEVKVSRRGAHVRARRVRGESS
jgi:VWFA-related protein